MICKTRLRVDHVAHPGRKWHFSVLSTEYVKYPYFFMANYGNIHTSISRLTGYILNDPKYMLENN